MLEGVDVSSYQGYVNWGLVQTAGKRFAAVKATEGVSFKDATLPHNWISLHYRKMAALAYHFLHPSIDGAQQADYLHGWVRECGHFQHGDAVMLDLEMTDGLDAEAVIRCAETFILRAWDQINKPVIVYTGPWFYNGILGGIHSSVLARCPLWIAEYGPKIDPIANWPDGASFWQYSEHGYCPGVNGEVDLDRFLGTGRQLHQIMTIVPEH